jgi:alkylhydroperoxidase/carboxymuconolactone decarboxylase family protein YurZ
VTDEADARQRARDRLYGRYDPEALDNGVRLQGEQFLGRVEELDQLDPTWTEGWLRWIYGSQYRRTVLDDKTRILVAVGEHTVLGHSQVLPTHIRSAIAAGATPYEVLEVIWMCHVYAGIPKAFAAMEIWRRVVTEDGHLDLDDLVLKQPRLDQR